MTDVEAEYTRFARAALSRYGYDHSTPLRLISVSENGTFLLGSDDERVVMRVHRSDYHSARSVASELDWMAQIAADTTIATPSVIPALDGSRVIEVAVDGVSRLVDLFTFVPGDTADDRDGAVAFAELGAITARLHKHARGWRIPAGFTRFRWDLDAAFGTDARWGDWRDCPGLTAADAEVIESAVEVLTERLHAFGETSDRFGLIHADLRMSNVMVSEDGLTIIDFDDCGFGWFLCDLAAVVSWIEGTARAEEIVEEWLTGYEAVRPLSDAELDMVPSFVLLRRLMLTSWIGSHPHSEPARRFGTSFGPRTAELAGAYLADPHWHRVHPARESAPTC